MVILDRQELIGPRQRHYQILRDGTIQQRKANNKVWSVELPPDGNWKELITPEPINPGGYTEK